MYQYDGLGFSVSIDLQTSHSFVVNGSLSAWNQFGEENIECETLGVYAHNEWFASGFAIGTLHILVNTVMDYDKQTIVGHFVDHHWWAVPVSRFYPNVLRKPASTFKVVFQDKFNITRWNDQLFVSNLERNILIKIIDTEKFVLQHLDFKILLQNWKGSNF